MHGQAREHMTSICTYDICAQFGKDYYILIHFSDPIDVNSSTLLRSSKKECADK